MNRLKALLLALLVAPIVSCADSTSPGQGRLTLLLTDAAGDFEAAVVTISQIYLQGGEGEGSEGGRVVLFDRDTTVNLLDLANSTAEMVKDAAVPAGGYHDLRFVITGGYIEVEQADGSTRIYASSPSYEGLPDGAQVDGELRMPSFSASGLKVKLPGDLMNFEGGEQKIVLVDFDVSKSFGHAAGGSGAWVMHPVIFATELSMSGSLGVSVTKNSTFTGTLEGFKAVLEDTSGAKTELALTDADANGTFEGDFLYLLPMSYKLSLTAPAGVTFATEPVLPLTIGVASGAEVEQAIVVKAPAP